ncbi:TPA: ash family protein [Aeromonas veronii bv. veronii]|nr:ash family protein [Aeromonas veronii bv. veronii]
MRPNCTRVMTGWAGQPQGWPVSLGAGSLNPVQLVTSSRLRPLW